MINESNVKDIFQKLVSNNMIDPKEKESVLKRFYELAYYGTNQEIQDESDENDNQKMKEKEEKYKY